MKVNSFLLVNIAAFYYEPTPGQICVDTPFNTSDGEMEETED